uniref:Uncharacterized protein n=1 Tax=Anguilla anguilla TaxID=7936 RepID=A0A0E9UMZ5_ANGAN
MVSYTPETFKNKLIFVMIGLQCNTQVNHTYCGNSFTYNVKYNTGTNTVFGTFQCTI